MAVILGDNTYYVSSNTADNCPQPCHALSYYITNTATYFTSNATFIFMEGEHLLDSKGSVQVVINNVDNLTLRGESNHSNTGIIIRCSSNTHGLVFNNGSIILYGIIITGCGQQDIIPLSFINIATLYIHHVTLYNNIYSSRYTVGGALYIYSARGTQITIANSTITNNIVDVAGGGLCMIYTGFRNDTYNNITITNSAFTSNTVGKFGGGLYVDNTGTNNNILIIANSTIANNHGSGIVLLHHVTLIFTEGHSIVADNSSPADGGGVFLSGNSYLTTSNGGHVSFINNTAHRYGGAIYSADDYKSAAVRSQGIYYYHYVQCTLYNVSGTFINNSAARAGDQLYGGIFTYCKGDHEYSYNDLQHLLHCPSNSVPDTIKHATSVHPLSPVSSDPIAVCPCISGTVNCNITSLDREVYPGQMFNVSLVTVGLCGGVSPGYIIVEQEHGDHISLISDANTDYTSTSCTTLSYTVKLTTYIIPNTTIRLNINVPDADSHIIGDRPINVNLTILPCPLGLVINFTSGGCVCNNDITHISGVSCNTSWMPYPIQRSGNNWMHHQYGSYNCTIAHIGCPFDYCRKSYVKFALDKSDLQCNYNRSGILCGQCIQGLSLMIGSNRCANCTDTTLISVSIVILAAVAGIVLVILLMVLNLTVSVGSVNGLLFYANLVKLNESIFFSNGNIPVITQFISWCNLDLGFEYCFIDGLDGYVKVWLQFVFPMYVWFLIIVIIIGCRYSGRLTRLCGHNAVPVLATLILMSYTKLSRTITNALMMNTLQCREYKWRVWNVDGNIDYLGGKHAVLFAVSLLFLITGVVYTGLVFSSQWLQRYSGKCCKSTRDPVVRLKPLIDAYTGPFKDMYRFWTGLCLIVRSMLTVVFSFTTILQSKLNNYIILLIVIAMIVVLASGRVYKNKYLLVLEIFSYINIICLCVLTVLFTDGYSHVVSINVIVSVSVSIEILILVAIITVHCYLAFKGFPNCKTHVNVPSEDDEQPLDLISGDREDGFLSSIIVHREELIFDIYLNAEHS